MTATAAANMEAELALQRPEAALQRADDAGGDARRMPVHAHHGSERLEPERMGKPAQKLIASEMMHDRLGDDSTEARHADPQPLRDTTAVQREIGTSGPLRQRVFLSRLQQMAF